jgi:uncharacterized protein (DUF362 family)
MIGVPQSAGRLKASGHLRLLFVGLSFTIARLGPSFILTSRGCLMSKPVNRREFIQGFGLAAAGFSLRPASLLAQPSAPTAPVAVAKCATYGAAAHATLATMFDQLGGLERLVKGKTVAIKLNLTGSPAEPLRGMPMGLTTWVHPDIITSTINLLGKAGARRIRALESTADPKKSFEEFVAAAGWNPRDFASAASGVEFENTNYPGPSGNYARVTVPGGGLLFKAWDVNHAYVDCDVYVSLAKLKEHGTAGVTLSMKNSFGLPPLTIYGTGAGIDRPAKVVGGPRLMLHDGSRQPSRSSLPENNPSSPRDPGYRVPRVTVDLVAARPIHLAIIDGISTAAGGEGPWVKHCRPVHAGVLVAGTNCVTTDAVATALMGFDPMAERGTAPFEKSDSTLQLAEQIGLGTRDLKRIEVLGVPIAQARMNFRCA